MNMEKNFWRDKNVFVTGHTGFKGGWLSLWLQAMGANVFGYALEPDSKTNMFDRAEVGKGMHSVFGDLLDIEHLEREMVAFAPDVVFHLAAQPIVLDAHAAPRETYITNIIGTVNLFECIRKTKSIKAIVNITTDKCYKNVGSQKIFSEEDRLGGSDPYSSSKASVELISDAYRSSYFNELEIGLATGRAGNVIGGGDWGKYRLVPDILASLHAGERVIVRSPNSIRPWQHVLEPLQGYLFLGQRLCENRVKFNGGWNFGPAKDQVITVRELVCLASEIWGTEPDFISEDSSGVKEDLSLQLDSGKAQRQLDWNPTLNIKEALSLTVKWHLEYSSGGDMRDFSLNQIDSYASLWGGMNAIDH